MTITVSPTYPAAGEEVTLATTLGDAAAARFEITTRPPKSAVPLGLAVDTAGNPVQSIVFDVPGPYTVKGYGYWRFIAPAAYPGDPVGGRRDKLAGTEDPFTLNVGGYVELPIAPTNGHASTLRLLVVDVTPPSSPAVGYVRAASLMNPATELARVAAEDASVAAAVAALVGLSLSDLDNELATNVASLQSAYSAHRQLTAGGVHLVADTTNVLVGQAPRNNAAAIPALNELAAKIGLHETQHNTFASPWHSADDTKNVLAVSPGASNLASATVLCADLRYRVYQRHIAQTSSPAVHGAEDTTNRLSPALPLTVAIIAYLDYVATATPSAPTNEAAGIADFQARFGMR